MLRCDGRGYCAFAMRWNSLRKLAVLSSRSSAGRLKGNVPATNAPLTIAFYCSWQGIYMPCMYTYMNPQGGVTALAFRTMRSSIHCDALVPGLRTSV